MDSPHTFFHSRTITVSNHSTHANIVSTDYPSDASLREIQWQICDLSNTHQVYDKSLLTLQDGQLSISSKQKFFQKQPNYQQLHLTPFCFRCQYHAPLLASSLPSQVYNITSMQMLQIQMYLQTAYISVRNP